MRFSKEMRLFIRNFKWEFSQRQFVAFGTINSFTTPNWIGTCFPIVTHCHGIQKNKRIRVDCKESPLEKRVDTMNENKWINLINWFSRNGNLWARPCVRTHPAHNERIDMDSIQETIVCHSNKLLRIWRSHRCALFVFCKLCGEWSKLNNIPQTKCDESWHFLIHGFDRMQSCMPSSISIDSAFPIHFFRFSAHR